MIDISALPHTWFPRERTDDINLMRLQNTKACWNAEELVQATEGSWAVPPLPDWRALGLCYFMPSFFPGAMAWLSKDGSPSWLHGGFTLAQLHNLRHYLAGVICENPEGCLGLGIPVLVVSDMETALLGMGKFARDRYNGKVIAITGSAGKTGTIYLLADMLVPFGTVDYTRMSHNLDIMTSVVMSSMSRDIPFWLLEMTYSKIRRNSHICRPHVAVMLTIAEAHLYSMRDLRGVALQKSRIFEGMEPGGIAVLNRDMPEYALIEEAAVKKGLRLIRFGRHQEVELRLLDYSGGLLRFNANGDEYKLSSSLPDYMSVNIMAALACVSALGLSIEQSFPALAHAQMLAGRGKRHSLRVGGKNITLIDDSYNANVASMSASLRSLNSAVPNQSNRLVILGDMAELGSEEAKKHLEMEDPIREAAPDRLLLCGPLMRPLWDRLKVSIKGAWFADPTALEAEVFSWLMPDDAILVKSSGHKLTKIVEKMLQADRSSAAIITSPALSIATSPTLSIAFGGNVNLGRRQHEMDRRNGYAYALAGLDALTKADFSMVNLACVVATSGRHGVEQGESGSCYCRARPEQLQVLAEAGIDLVFTANSHSGDYGVEALLEQKILLEEAGFLHAGSGTCLQEAGSPVFVRIGECTLAVFSVDATCWFFSAGEDRPGIWHLPPHNSHLWYNELTPRISLARREADIVLVAVHWGDNEAQKPTPAQRRIGRTIIKAGADAVLGLSSTLQGIEAYMHRPIIYAADDLLFDAPAKGCADSGIFVLKLCVHGITEVSFYPIERNYGYSLPATGEKAAESIACFREKSAALGVALEAMPDHARLSFSPFRRPNREIPEIPKIPYAVSVRQPAVKKIPPPLLQPKPEWITTTLPNYAHKESRQIGPLTLHGWYMPPECLHMDRRRILWIESWWSVETPSDKDLLLYFVAAPVGGGMPVYGQDMWHDPCDWMWPTSRWQTGVLYRDVAGLPPPLPSQHKQCDLIMYCRVMEGEKVLAQWVLPEKISLLF